MSLIKHDDKRSPWSASSAQCPLGCHLRHPSAKGGGRLHVRLAQRGAGDGRRRGAGNRLLTWHHWTLQALSVTATWWLKPKGGVPRARSTGYRQTAGRRSSPVSLAGLMGAARKRVLFGGLMVVVLTDPDRR